MYILRPHMGPGRVGKCAVSLLWEVLEMTTLIAIYFGVVYTFGNYSSLAACQEAIQKALDACPKCELHWQCVSK